MRTIFPFTLQIDDDVFELEYKNISKQKSDELVNRYKTLKQDIATFERLEKELKNLYSKKELKEELIKIKKESEKEILINEVLSLIDEISKLEKQKVELDEKNVDLEELSFKRFDLSICKNKEVLQETIEKKGISYYDIMIVIDEAIQKEKEKK